MHNIFVCVHAFTNAYVYERIWICMYKYIKYKRVTNVIEFTSDAEDRKSFRDAIGKPCVKLKVTSAYYHLSIHVQWCPSTLRIDNYFYLCKIM